MLFLTDVSIRVLHKINEKIQFGITETMYSSGLGYKTMPTGPRLDQNIVTVVFLSEVVADDIGGHLQTTCHENFIFCFRSLKISSFVPYTRFCVHSSLARWDFYLTIWSMNLRYDHISKAGKRKATLEDLIKSVEHYVVLPPRK